MNPIEKFIAHDIEQFERETGIPYRTMFKEQKGEDASFLSHVIMPADFHMKPWPGFPAGIE